MESNAVIHEFNAFRLWECNYQNFDTADFNNITVIVIVMSMIAVFTLGRLLVVITINFKGFFPPQ